MTFFGREDIIQQLYGLMGKEHFLFSHLLMGV